MKSSDTDTIAAIATAAGRGGIGIVRLSGPDAAKFAAALLGRCPAPRVATYAKFLGDAGEVIDEGLALWFPAPHSFTGQDVLELQGHGGPVVLEMLLARVVELGARRAGPGEFTQRAYLNDKLDLAQAEAVADLIDAGSRAAARAAVRSLQGEFSRHVHELDAALVDLRVWVEAALDFPEEEIDFLADRELRTRMTSVRARFDAIEAAAVQGRVLRDGMTVVIAGRPNAGKSSLLNALAGHDAAIVTPIAGTTRDILRERIDIDGMPLHVLDTAGLRDETADEVEAEGMRRARLEMARADRVLFVIDAAADPRGRSYEAERARLPADVPVTLLFNKADLAASDALPLRDGLRISAKTGAGLVALRTHLKECMRFTTPGTDTISARARHLEALRTARTHVEHAYRNLVDTRAGELVAEDLQCAHRAIGEITGEFSAEDLLGRIFSSFCIGK
jgi:tRNA modification GTPase